jgi:phospholipid/cholesterol/gamma-HCH transport system substrate-binding protein
MAKQRSISELTRISVVGAIVLCLIVATVALRNGTSGTRINAYFHSTDGIYAGDEVRVLGVPVGKITDIDVTNRGVLVKMSVDSDVAIPADAKAVIVSPSLVSSRYVQLTPRYSGGARMTRDMTIPLSRTAVPIEWETVKTQLDDVVTALGPTGTDQHGALSHLLHSTSDALSGNGDTINGAIANLGSALATLDQGGSDLFSTVRNLEIFVSALYQSNKQVAEFISRLDTVSDAFDDDKELIRPALEELSGAVGEVDAFVKDNRGTLNTTLTELAKVASIVAKRQADLAQTLHVAPFALENLNRSYKERQNAVSVNLVGANAIHAPGQLICGAIGGAAGTSGEATMQLCSKLVGDLLDQVANTPQSQQLLNALLLLLSGGSS